MNEHSKNTGRQLTLDRLATPVEKIVKDVVVPVMQEGRAVVQVYPDGNGVLRTLGKRGVTEVRVTGETVAYLAGLQHEVETDEAKREGSPRRTRGRSSS